MSLERALVLLLVAALLFVAIAAQSWARSREKKWRKLPPDWRYRG